MRLGALSIFVFFSVTTVVSPVLSILAVALTGLSKSNTMRTNGTAASLRVTQRISFTSAADTLLCIPEVSNIISIRKNEKNIFRKTCPPVYTTFKHIDYSTGLRETVKLTFLKPLYLLNQFDKGDG